MIENYLYPVQFSHSGPVANSTIYVAVDINVCERGVNNITKHAKPKIIQINLR